LNGLEETNVNQEPVDGRRQWELKKLDIKRRLELKKAQHDQVRALTGDMEDWTGESFFGFIASAAFVVALLFLLFGKPVEALASSIVALFGFLSSPLLARLGQWRQEKKKGLGAAAEVDRPFGVNGTLRKCRACGDVVSTGTSKCPHCGSSAPAMSQRAHSTLVMVVFTVMLILASFYSASHNLTGEDKVRWDRNYLGKTGE